MVIRTQQEALTHCGGLLPDGQMGRSQVIVLDALVDALRLDLLQHILELPDEKHVLVDPHQGLGAVGLEFLFGGSGVLVERNLGANEFAALAFLLWFDYLGLGHDLRE